ncbi:hypothetical protein HOLleu_36563 [Holothuria leucospilota]|uniref:Uncharacterized protein n=1 Tax=Holothuria leucospilota TaxID=206669 RepID=A0A9Q1BGQ3_HOLLE|nr:hypothetical protein HOLleu_36563 [Holothuria leucospilota]
MRWKVIFFKRDNLSVSTDSNSESDDEDICSYGLKSRKCPPHVKGLIPFEDDMAKLVENIDFRQVKGKFQAKLHQTLKEINSSSNVYAFADKSQNMYKMSNSTYNNLLKNSITSKYKQGNENVKTDINSELHSLACQLNIEQKISPMAERGAFVTIKDHKYNFPNNPSCRLINPAKSELGKVSQHIVNKINSCIRSKLSVNQWRNTSSVIEWFENISEKERHTFVIFDIIDFYPSISEDLLTKALEWANSYTNTSQLDITTIMHARKSLLFHKSEPWVKRYGVGLFDVTMGSYDGAEICWGCSS